MRVTIVTDDDMVAVDGLPYLNLDLSTANIPPTVHALQWDGVLGRIEYRDYSGESLTELPDWANISLGIWQDRYNEVHRPPTEQELKGLRIDELQQLLFSTDYVTLSDYDKDKTDVIAQRAAWRAELRALLV